MQIKHLAYKYQEVLFVRCVIHKYL